MLELIALSDRIISADVQLTYRTRKLCTDERAGRRGTVRVGGRASGGGGAALERRAAGGRRLGGRQRAAAAPRALLALRAASRRPGQMGLARTKGFQGSVL